MQEKLESSAVFLERTDRLAAALGVTVSELPPVISLSNGMLFAYRKGRYPISRKAWIKLEAAERAAGVAPISAPPKESTSRAEAQTGAGHDQDTSAREPTREDCLGYLAGYLDEAAGVPGAVGYVWIQLNTHLPRDLLRRLKPAAAGPPASGAALAALGFSPEEIRRARRDADEALRRTDAAAAAPRDERRHA
jgi:hypothetical protein